MALLSTSSGSFGVYREQDLRIVRADGSHTSLFPDAQFEAHAALSPDERWIAYESNRSGVAEVFVERFPEMTERVQISTGGGASPVWAGDGSRLFYASLDGRQLFAVALSAADGMKASSPRVMVEGTFLPATWPLRAFDVMPDGKRFVALKRDISDPSMQMVVVENWLGELTHRAK